MPHIFADGAHHLLFTGHPHIAWGRGYRDSMHDRPQLAGCNTIPATVEPGDGRIGMGRQGLPVTVMSDLDEHSGLQILRGVLKDARQGGQARGVAEQQLPRRIRRRVVEAVRAVQGHDVARLRPLGPIAGQSALMHNEVDVQLADVLANVPDRVGRTSNGTLAAIGISPAPLLVDMRQVQAASGLVGEKEPHIFVGSARAGKTLEARTAKCQPQHSRREIAA